MHSMQERANIRFYTRSSNKYDIEMCLCCQGNRFQQLQRFSSVGVCQTLQTLQIVDRLVSDARHAITFVLFTVFTWPYETNPQSSHIGSELNSSRYLLVFFSARYSFCQTLCLMKSQMTILCGLFWRMALFATFSRTFHLLLICLPWINSLTFCDNIPHVRRYLKVPWPSPMIMSFKKTILHCLLLHM